MMTAMIKCGCEGCFYFKDEEVIKNGKDSNNINNMWNNNHTSSDGR